MENNVLFIYLTIWFWLLMSLYWAIKAKASSQTSFSFEITSLVKMITSFLIIYLPLLTGGWFAKELYASNIWTNIMGATFCGLGIGFAIWARNVLGGCWSGKVTIQKEHKLIKEGPYSVVRHPQYTGFLLALFGTALMLGKIFSFVWYLFLIVSLIAKAKQEEKILAKIFPNEYLEYKQKVKMIIPYVY